MIRQIIYITLLFAITTCYTEQGNVLVLTDDDFPSITNQFSHILIQFYAPWCGHCKQLQPVYKEVADQLKAQGSKLKLAKLDATQHQKAAQQFQVRGFPTIFFFYNGQKVDYQGPRSKQGMLGWLLKRTRDPVSQIDTSTYENLQSEKSTSIVYHGDFSTAKNADILSKIAIADDYNNYYWAKNLGKEQGTVQLIRNFDSTLTYNGIDEKIKLWIQKNQRPIVVPFDERAIASIFSSGKKGLVLFNGESSDQLLQAFTEAGKQYSGDELFVFTEITADNQHLENFAMYLKLDRKAFPVIIVQPKSQIKYVLKAEPTKQNILSFLQNYKDFKYGINDQVKPEKVAEATTQEQL